MEKKNIIFILLFIFFIVILYLNTHNICEINSAIQIFVRQEVSDKNKAILQAVQEARCNENFESTINKLITTNISNTVYYINQENEKIILTNYKSNDAKINEFDTIKNEKIYNIYLNDKILRYNDDKNIRFVPFKPAGVKSFIEYFRLYKTTNNKLYFNIENKNKYLSINKEDNKNIVTSDNEEDGIIWIFE